MQMTIWLCSKARPLADSLKSFDDFAISLTQAWGKDAKIANLYVTRWHLANHENLMTRNCIFYFVIEAKKFHSFSRQKSAADKKWWKLFKCNKKQVRLKSMFWEVLLTSLIPIRNLSWDFIRFLSSRKTILIVWHLALTYLLNLPWQVRL